MKPPPAQVCSNNIELAPYGCEVHGRYSKPSHHCPDCIRDVVTLLFVIRDHSTASLEVQGAAGAAIARLGYAGCESVTRKVHQDLAKLAAIAEKAKAFYDATGESYPAHLKSLLDWLERVDAHSS